MNRLKKSLTYLFSTLIFFSLLLFSHCSSDGDSENEDAKLVGTWTLSAVEAVFMVDGKPLLEYLVDEGQLTEAEAEIIEALFEDLITEDLDDGEITLKSDNTYIADFGDDTETGKWSYDESTKILTIDPDDPTEDTQEITVKSISSSTLVIEQSETIEEEIDEGMIVEIDATIEMTFTKSS